MTPSYSLNVTRAIVVLVLLGTATITVLGQQTAARPDRGVMPNGSYAVSDIENISLTNGNVNLGIPLASLPPIAGGKLSWTINAHYNSKLWNMNRVQLLGERYDLSEVPYVVDTPELSEQGGWRISGQYQIEIRDARSDFDYQLPPLDDPDYALMNTFNWYRAVLIMPDGAQHELRPMDYSPFNGGKSFLYGYFKEHPYTHGTMRYYSFDGSYLYASITSDNNWTVYLPDGTKIVQTTDGIQRIQDTNGNKIKIWNDTNGAHYQDEQTGREIRYVLESPEEGRVYYKTVTGGDAHVKIMFGETTVQGQLYKVNDWEPGQVSDQPGWTYQELNTVIPVIREIVLPETQPQVTRKISFEYSSDDTEIATNPTRTASKGWGYLSRIEMPSEAKIDYTYFLDSSHKLFFSDDLARMSITQKKLDHDGTIDPWTYSINEETSTVSNPDGSTITEAKFSHLPYLGSSFGKSGLAYRTTRPFSKTERHWTHRVFDGASVFSPNGNVDFNSVVDYEYTTLTDAAGNNLKMSAKAFQYDYNGNVTQTTEYDWFDPALVSRDAQGVPTGVPGSATVLRTTTNSYYNPATSSSSGNVYAKRSISTALILNALKQTTTEPAAVAQFSYDDNAYGTAPTVGNLTSKKVWADLDSKWITTSATYNSFGNVTSATDGRGKVTSFYYDDATHALPNRVVVDPQNVTGTQTTTTAYDYYTGLVTSVTDPNNAVSSIDYTNQLLPGGAKDPFGRPAVTLGPLVNVNGVNQRQKTTTTYYDSTRQVITASDLYAENDKLLKTRTTADKLGRVVLVEQTEDGTNYTISSRTAYDTANRMTFSSGPMRSGTASTDSWTRVTNDIAGRAVEVATFAGATQPGTAAANQIAGWTGSVTTAYEANLTTVLDQAGKQRRSVADGLGRLIRVDEPDKDSGQLGSTAQPIQPTCYQYNVLGNLTKVIQGSQVDPVTGICALSGSQQRTFTYDSLSRLRTAQNPESGTLTYTYDDNGNLLTKLDARSIASSHVYDSLNRVTSRSYSDGTPTVTYVYDTLSQNGKGRLTSVTSSVSSYSYSGYNAMGRVTGASQTIGAQTYTITNIAYELAGHLKTMTYPSGRTVTNSYDNAGRLSSFSGNLGDGGSPRTYANDFQYTALNGLQQERFGTATPIYHKQRYNSRGQLWDLRASTVSFSTDAANGDRGAIVNYYSNNFVQGGNGPDNNGNLLRQENYIPGGSFFQDNFTYDSLNRLTSIAEKLNGTGTDSFKQAYVYDRWGNRVIDQVNTTPNVPKPDFGVNTSNNRLTAPAGYSMSYDAAGNLTNDTYTGQGARTHDAENRMKQAWANSQWQTYSYDGDGRRVKRLANGTETWQVYGLGGELLAEYPANGTPTSPQKEYGYRNGELLVTAETSSGGGGGSSAQPVIWTNAVGVSVSGNNLTKTAPESWGNSGASSTQAIASGDGYVEFTTTGSPYQYVVCGLSHGDTNQNYPDVDFGLYAAATNLYVVENSNVFQVSTYTVSDTLRVAVESGVVKYRKNGTVVYTSTLTPTYPLLVDTALYLGGISNAVINNGAGGGGGAQNASWTNTVGVAANSNSLTKTAADGWNNSGASSTQTIASGDGYVEFTASETTTARMCGLGHSDPDQNYGIDFALGAWPGGTLYRFEFGVYSVIGTYATGDVLRVAVEGGAVKYRKNGTLLYTSTVPPTYPLLVDTSLYSNGGTLNNVVISGGGGGGGSSANVKWLVADHLGTPRMVFDQTGSLANVSRHDYLPFGEELFGGPPSQPGIGGRTTTMGYTASDNVRQKFTKYERDNETGLDYAQARYYSPSLGRFTGVDPLMGSGMPEMPQSWNRYAYCINNPLQFVDPTGLIWGWKDLGNGNQHNVWFETEAEMNEAGYTAMTQFLMRDPNGGFISFDRNSSFYEHVSELAVIGGFVNGATGLRAQGYTSNSFWFGGLIRVLEGGASAQQFLSQDLQAQRIINSPEFQFLSVYSGTAALELAAARPTVGLSMQGKAFEFGELEKHLAGTPSAARQAAAGEAHVFNNLATMSRVESEIFARGIHTGSRAGFNRYGLLFDRPIGLRIGKDGATTSLNYGQLKLDKNGLYHLIPRAQGPGK